MKHEILKNFNLFVQDKGHIGVCSELTLPKIAMKTEEYRGAGMDAPIDIEMGMEKLECEFTLTRFDSETLQLLGFSHSKPVRLKAKGAVEDVNTGSVSSAEILMEGTLLEADFGTLKPGEKSESKFKCNLRYYKYTTDGREVVEIDIPGMVRKIGGVDQLDERRKALGV